MFFDVKLDAFTPTVQKLFRKYGRTYREEHLMTPGYVFVETPMEPERFFNCFPDVRNRSSSILKLLHYGDPRDIAVGAHERDILELLWYNSEQGNTNEHKKRCCMLSTGEMIGNQIVILDGPLKNHEGMIKCIQRHKREATIEMVFMGVLREIRVGLEIIKRI
jgi:transcriptional antiterminator NusG